MNNCIFTKKIKIYLSFVLLTSLSLPVYAQSPGNVSSNLYMWLRADDQTVLAGGAQVQRWNNVDGNTTRFAIQGTANQRPTLINSQINGHKVLRFDGLDDYMIMDVAATALTDDCTIFMVVTPNEDSDVGYYLSTHFNGDDRLKFGHKLTGELTYDNTVPVMWNDNMHNKKTMVAFQMEQDFYVDGYKNAELAAPWTHNLQNSGANQASLGQEYDGLGNPSNHWKGDMAEVIIFNRFLTYPEMDQVHSYLNVRYGINIPVENHVYFNHTGYPENIAGLGMDTNQNLSQTNSQSEETGAVVRMNVPSNLSEDEYLVWGNDGATTAVTSAEIPGTVSQRITREWRVAETGNVGTVSVSFDLSELGLSAPFNAADFGLMIDSDNGDFSNATIHTTGANISGNILTFNQVPFNDGNWFTLATQLQGAVCIGIDIKVLLEGPLDASAGEMQTGLNDRGMLPGQTPISVLGTPTPAGQPYNAAPWNYTGTEGAGWTNTNYNADVVDWILVSFRTGLDVNTEVAKAAALLKKDGSVEFLDPCVLDGSVTGPFHILVEHRNHIGALTSTPVDVVGNTLTFDFTTTNTLSAGQKLIGPKYCLYAGNSNQIDDTGGYDINGLDKALWDTQNGFFYQYSTADFSMNGDIDGADKSIWSMNNGIASVISK